MLYAYVATTDRPAWKLVLPEGEYALAPTAARPGGPALFTSGETAQAFLAYHDARWGSLEGARIEPVDGGLAGFLAAWREAFSEAGEHG